MIVDIADYIKPRPEDRLCPKVAGYPNPEGRESVVEEVTAPVSDEAEITTAESAVNVIDSVTAQADAEKEADKQWEILKASIPGYTEALEASRRQRENEFWEAQRREDCRLLGTPEEAFNAASEARDGEIGRAHV